MNDGRNFFDQPNKNDIRTLYIYIYIYIYIHIYEHIYAQLQHKTVQSPDIIYLVCLEVK